MTVRRIGFATSDSYPDLAPSDRLAADLLRQQGLEVVPLVWTETEPGVVGCELVVIRSVWNYHLYADRFLEWVNAVAKRATVFNSPETIRWNADKRYLLDLEKAGLPVPKLVVLEQGSQIDVADALQVHGFKSAVIKPVISASAFETHFAEAGSAAALQPRLNELLQSRSLLMQEFVPEITSKGEWSLMFFSGKYSHAVLKLPSAGDFRVQAEHGGSHRIESPGKSVIAMAQETVDRFAANTLYARIDIVEGKSSPLIMEVELIDPELFLTADSDSPRRFTEALQRMMEVAMCPENGDRAGK